jgi:hypothetical protein
MTYVQTPLLVFNNVPFNIGTQVDALDVITANGTSAAFDVTYKPIANISGIVQVGGQQYNQANGGFVRTTTGILLPSPPPTGTQVIIPGIIRLTLNAYDQSTVAGITNPNIGISPFFICDPSTITTNFYEATYGQSGIRASIVDNDTANGAVASWCQLGYGVPFTGAAPSTWNASGSPLYFPPLQAFDNLGANIAANATSITVENGSSFALPSGQNCVQFIRLGAGLSTQDDVRVTGMSGNTITISPTSYAHNAGETIYQLAFGGYIMLTLPTTTTIGPVSYYDLSLNLLYDVAAR